MGINSFRSGRGSGREGVGTVGMTREGLVAIKRAARTRGARQHKSLDKVDYENAWDEYARTWRFRNPKLGHIGDEWTGEHAGAAGTVEEYCKLIESHYIAPYIEPGDSVMEIGVGGGKTAALLKQQCGELICADISAEMLAATRERIGDAGVRYVKLDGIKLPAFACGHWTYASASTPWCTWSRGTSSTTWPRFPS